MVHFDDCPSSCQSAPQAITQTARNWKSDTGSPVDIELLSKEAGGPPRCGLSDRDYRLSSKAALAKLRASIRYPRAPRLAFPFGSILTLRAPIVALSSIGNLYVCPCKMCRTTTSLSKTSTLKSVAGMCAQKRKTAPWAVL